MEIWAFITGANCNMQETAGQLDKNNSEHIRNHIATSGNHP